MITYRMNEEKNGIEVITHEKPAAAIREELKNAGFRWGRGYWYAKQTPARLALAQKLAGEQPAEVVAPKPPAVIDLSGLENNKKTNYGAEFSATLRAELKKRGVQGVTIRASKSTYTDHITATIKTTAEDYRSAEEVAARDNWSAFFKAQDHWGFTLNGVHYGSCNEGKKTATEQYITCGSRYDDESPESNAPILRAFWLDRIGKTSSINIYHATPENYPEFKAAAFDRIAAVLKIIQSFNYDNSDPMTDYFDCGFFLDIDIKRPENFTPRERMTEAERAQLVADLKAAKEAEEAKYKEWEREREAARREAEAAAEQEKKDRAEIAAAVEVENLEEAQKYYIYNLRGGIGKECNIKELQESADRPETAHISRRVTFKTAEALEKFSSMFLYDFEFLAGMGGTGTNDPRVNGENINKLNSDQRAAVEWVAVECVAVYFGGVLQFVINPEGYNYARYVYLPTEDTTEATPAESAAKDAEEAAAAVDPFYFPAPITAQAENLTPGQELTIFQTSDWLCNMTQATSGTLTEAAPGNYAQYSGVWLTIKAGRKSARVFCRDGKPTAIFKGAPLPMPESVIYKKITRTAGATLREYRDNIEQIKLIIQHYAACGIAPLLDTVQR